MTYQALLDDLEKLVSDVERSTVTGLEALLAKYEPSQPRDDDGQWTDDGGGDGDWGDEGKQDEMGPYVPGNLVVRDDVPNMDSISASLDDYEVVPGIQQVDLPPFDGNLGYAAADDNARVRSLAGRIHASGEINPLIVVQDAEGLYVLEGGHRWNALRLLGEKTAPAVLVRDLESLDAAGMLKFDPDQPRANDGKWTDTGAGGFDQDAPFPTEELFGDGPESEANAYTDAATSAAMNDPAEMLFGDDPLGLVERHAATKYLDGLNGDVQLSPVEEQALEDYVDGGYQELNGHLRGSPKFANPGEVRLGVLNKKIDELDGAFAKVPALDREVVTWRGAGKASWADGLAAGDSFQDDGYVSTSVSPTIAARFSQPEEATYTMFRLRLRPGTRGVWMKKAIGDGSELEMVLPRRTQFTVSSVEVISGEEYSRKYVKESGLYVAEVLGPYGSQRKVRIIDLGT